VQFMSYEQPIPDHPLDQDYSSPNNIYPSIHHFLHFHDLALFPSLYDYREHTDQVVAYMYEWYREMHQSCFENGERASRCCTVCLVTQIGRSYLNHALSLFANRRYLSTIT
jgi:hypothetical protein